MGEFALLRCSTDLRLAPPHRMKPRFLRAPFADNPAHSLRPRLDSWRLDADLSTLEVTSTLEADGFVHIAIGGDLNLGALEALESEFEKWIEREEFFFKFDLSQLSFLSSAAASSLIALARTAQDREGDLFFTLPEPKVLKVFEDLGYVDLLPFIRSLKDSVRIVTDRYQDPEPSRSSSGTSDPTSGPLSDSRSQEFKSDGTGSGLVPGAASDSGAAPAPPVRASTREVKPVNQEANTPDREVTQDIATSEVTRLKTEEVSQDQIVENSEEAVSVATESTASAARVEVGSHADGTEDRVASQGDSQEAEAQSSQLLEEQHPPHGTQKLENALKSASSKPRELDLPAETDSSKQPVDEESESADEQASPRATESLESPDKSDDLESSDPRRRDRQATEATGSKTPSPTEENDAKE